MAELKCPHCGQAFTVDDTELSSIVKQIRDKEFEKDLNSRLSEIENHLKKEHALEIEAKDSEHKLLIEAKENEIKLKTKEEYEKEISKLKKDYDALMLEMQNAKHELDSVDEKKQIAIYEAVESIKTEKQKEIDELKSTVSNVKSELELEKSAKKLAVIEAEKKAADEKHEIFGVTCRTIGAEVVTQSITTNLIRNTDIGKTVYAEAHIHHAGRTTIVLEADVFTEEKKLMAHSIATMFVSGTDDRFPRKWDEN